MENGRRGDFLPRLARYPPNPMNNLRTAHQWTRAAVIVAACALAGAAHAQLRLPGGGGIGLPALPQVPVPQLNQPLRQAVPLQELRATLTRELVARNPQRVESDPAGEPIRRAELLWLSPSVRALESARAQGFVLLRETSLPELDVREFVM